jgi:hypothetical protein
MDLFEIVETIDAKRCSFQSIQTEHPEKDVRVTTRNMTVVDEGKTYLI